MNLKISPALMTRSFNFTSNEDFSLTFPINYNSYYSLSPYEILNEDCFSHLIHRLMSSYSVEWNFLLEAWKFWSRNCYPKWIIIHPFMLRLEKDRIKLNSWYWTAALFLVCSCRHAIKYMSSNKIPLSFSIVSAAFKAIIELELQQYFHKILLLHMIHGQ